MTRHLLERDPVSSQQDAAALLYVPVITKYVFVAHNALKSILTARGLALDPAK